MKKWLPYVVAAVLGLGVAVVMFMPSTKPDAPTPAAQTEPKQKASKKAKTATPDGFSIGTEPTEGGIDYPDAKTAAADGSPEPGTLRPLNEGELSRMARAERPFNKHYVGVAQYWNRIGPLIGATDAALAKECQQMELYLRDQSRLEEGDLNVAETIEAELRLEKKVRALGVENDQLNGILDYINSSANSVIQGGDPSTIPKPGKG